MEIIVRNKGDGSFITMVYSTCSFTYLYDLIIWDWSFSDKDGIPINRYLHSESSSWLCRSCFRWHPQAKRCGLSIIIKLEIGILNKFCSRLIFQYLSFSLVIFQGKFRNLKRENVCNLMLHIRRRVSKISGWPKRF